MMRLAGYEVPDTVDVSGLSPVKRQVVELLSREAVPDQFAAFIAAGLERFIKDGERQLE